MEIKVITGDEVQRTPQPDGIKWPPGTDLVCAFDENKMVARVGCVGVYHLEGTWVDGEHRSSTLAYRVFTRMEHELRKVGLNAIFAFSKDAKVTEYLKRMGYRSEPVEVLVKEF